MKQLQIMARKAVSLFGVALILFSAAPHLASAYSFYGAGTEENPYRIYSCDQLQEMNDDRDASYRLVRNIDCSTFGSFAPIGEDGDAFTGTFNGSGYFINQPDLQHPGDNFVGLFGYVEGATISNVYIGDAAVSGTHAVGTLVGYAEDTAISNIFIDGGSVQSTGQSSGGLAGQINNTDISESAVTDVYLEGYLTVGGLVGRVVGPSTITNTFSEGYVDATTAVGGLVGLIFSATGSVSRSYANVTIHANGDEVGGLVGNNAGTVSDSFAVSDMSDPVANADTDTTGAVFGVQQNNISGIYFDVERAGLEDCVGPGGSPSLNCNGINSDGTEADFFEHSGSAPQNTWEFGDTGQWYSSDEDYPILNNLYYKQTYVDETPNGGDANDDGIPDSFQPFVVSLPNGGFDPMKWSTIEVPEASDCLVDNPEFWNNSDNYFGVDRGHQSQVPFYTGFKVYCKTPGRTISVTLYYHEPAFTTTNSVLRHFFYDDNTNTGTFSAVANPVFGTKDIDGDTVTTVTFNVTDGGAGDDDHTANGVIVDPVYIALFTGLGINPTTTTAPATGTQNILDFLSKH